ncbi:hypothetical protein [Cellulosimicrobium sp. Marseille-Q4280]|uniref:hypothetical protein n=1 Tax=Cellulosimicrobium sp. Marseille-Q4280 TaxID=2937992 RepID=UPI00203FC56D|nr:hypothetical protein [Cellulosimicrobium sp. Marseille-Q4280]
MTLAWTMHAWGSALPSTGSDELHRHTLVLPWPFKVTEVDEEDGARYHPALVLVVRPWWACRQVLRDRQVRAYMAWERRLARDLRRAGDDPSEEHLDTIERRWAYVRPPMPRAWQEDR